ncbi:hypothetical protein Ancab_038220 [Ancistrocladus abbreviatus]
MMEAVEKEEHLNLSLATVGQTKMKRKRTEFSSPPFLPSEEGNEGKIFRLLKVREQMLQQEYRKGSGLTEDRKGSLHLIHLLLVSASSVQENNVTSATDSLIQLYQSSSLTGDSAQRFAAYFADGLTARLLLAQKSPFCGMLTKEPTLYDQFFAFTHLYRVSPYYQFAHFTANQAILEAFEREQELKNSRALHVIDFNLSYGFQWPSLIQSLSEKATVTNPISLKITGFARNPEEIAATEARLVSFAQGFSNIVFEFQGLLRGSGLILFEQTQYETIAVNLVFHLTNSWNHGSKISDTLRTIRLMDPAIVVLVEQEGIGRTLNNNFVSNFMESLHHFTAIFDSLDDCLPRESEDRLSIERNHLAVEIKHSIIFNKDEMDCLRYGKMESWNERMDSHRFSGVKLSSRTSIQAKLLLRMRSHNQPQFEGDCGGGFRVFEKEDGGAISLGWQDRVLITASAWQTV